MPFFLAGEREIRFLDRPATTATLYTRSAYDTDPVDYSRPRTCEIESRGIAPIADIASDYRPSGGPKLEDLAGAGRADPLPPTFDTSWSLFLRWFSDVNAGALGAGPEI